MKTLAKLFFTLAMVASLGAPLAQAQREKLPPEDLEFVEKTWPEAKKTITGIRYLILRPGQGDVARPGDRVTVHYIGRFLDGNVFDRSPADRPLSFRVRRGDVIEGWDQILQQMRKGEKRIVIVPSELAYGTRGNPPKIGRNATLVFEMELVDIQRK